MKLMYRARKDPADAAISLPAPHHPVDTRVVDFGVAFVISFDRQHHEAACMAHARRKFHDLFVARRNEVNTQALRRIGELYAIEAAMRGKPPDERRRVRQEQARPLFDAFEIWLRSTLGTVS